MSDNQAVTYNKKGEPIYGRNAKGEPICAHPLKGSDRTRICRSTKVHSNGRCFRHGGNDNRSVVREANFNPHSRSMDIANRLSPKMRHVFDTSMNDPVQASLAPEIALLDTIIARGLDQLNGTAPDSRTLERLQSGIMELGMALESGELDQINSAYTYLTNVVNRGNDEESLKRELRTTVLQRSALVEADSKRMAQARLSLNATDAETLVVTIFRILATHETNPDILRKVQLDFSKYLAMSEERLVRKPTPVALIGGLEDLDA